jgi:hypothetical protein
MADAVPDLALSSLIDSIIALVDNTEVDVLRVARLERELAKLWAASAIDVANYHMTRAMLAMLRHKNSVAVSAARDAIRWAAGDYAIHSNCLTVMSVALEVNAALELLQLMNLRYPDNIDAIRDNIVKSSDLLQFSMSVELMEKFDRLNVNSPSQPKPLRQRILLTRDAMIRCGLTDEDLAARLDVVAGTLREKNFDVWRSSRITLTDGTFMYFVHVDADADRCAELTFDIADALVESFEDPGADLFTISCRPVTDLANIKEVNPTQL